MINPGRETFNRLGEIYNIVPLFKTVPADLETPISLYLKLTSHSKESFLLESGELGEKSRYSFIGSEPFLTLYTVDSDTVVQEESGKQWRSGDDPLDVLEKIFKGFKVYHPEELSAFWGGAVGYISYDMVRRWEKIPGIQEESSWPSCYFSFPRKVFIYDHRRHLLTAVYLAEVNGEGDDLGRVYEKASRELESILANIGTEQGASSPDISSAYEAETKSPGKDLLHQVPVFTRDSFASAVERAKEYIRAGDIFQVVLSRRTQRESSVLPFSIYRALRSLNPSPYQFYLSFPDFQLVGSSPEMLVKLEKGMAYTKPIAGTRPRGQDDKSDFSLAEELSKDEKERAEHMMLVDLGRNDLGKVCCYGSVEVTKLLEVEYFSHVMHLVSEVRGKIRPEYNFAHLLRSAFPAGTVSGAPKVRAMEIIAELEPLPRGPYAGAVGYLGFNGEIDTCITIRTILMSQGQAYIQAGAGIVADSDPYKEYEETEYKMASSLRALSLAEEWENDFNHR
ncbi:MAG: anthranilate synthase component I [Bacillota bacterium]|nr:anthranilate synthase component I [Bacillota bacterium]